VLLWSNPTHCLVISLRRLSIFVTISMEVTLYSIKIVTVFFLACITGHTVSCQTAETLNALWSYLTWQAALTATYYFLKACDQDQVVNLLRYVVSKWRIKPRMKANLRISIQESKLNMPMLSELVIILLACSYVLNVFTYYYCSELSDLLFSNWFILLSWQCNRAKRHQVHVSS